MGSDISTYRSFIVKTESGLYVTIALRGNTRKKLPEDPLLIEELQKYGISDISVVGKFLKNQDLEAKNAGMFRDLCELINISYVNRLTLAQTDSFVSQEMQKRRFDPSHFDPWSNLNMIKELIPVDAEASNPLPHFWKKNRF